MFRKSLFALFASLALTALAVAQVAFLPQGGASLSVTASTARVALPSTGPVAVVCNLGPNVVFVKLGDGTVTAATTDSPVLIGACIGLEVGNNTNVAGITAAGLSTLRVTSGRGPLQLTSASDNTPYPIGSTAITGAGTGTTGAVVGTLTSAANQTAYICGFDVSVTGGTATVGPIAVAGLTGPRTFTYQFFSTASGANLGKTFYPCIPASAVNTNITVTTTADATATAVDVNVWGFLQ